MRAPPRELIRFLKRFDPAIRELALDARELVLSVLEPANESILDVYVLALNYGFSERMKDQVVYIGVYTKHINLGFHWGARMDDPEGVLKGGGKQMRHIQIKSHGGSGDADRSRLPAAGGSRGCGAIEDSKDESVSEQADSGGKRPQECYATTPASSMMSSPFAASSCAITPSGRVS